MSIIYDNSVLSDKQIASCFSFNQFFDSCKIL